MTGSTGTPTTTIIASSNSNSNNNNYHNTGRHFQREQGGGGGGGVQPLPTTTLPEQRRTLRDQTLIELNNRAIDLLQAGFCRLCIDTFKDALELMKTTTATTTTTATPSNSGSTTTAVGDDANNRHQQSTMMYNNIVDRAETRRRTAAEQLQQARYNPTAAAPAAPYGLLVFAADHDATEVYHILATARTSRVALTMRTDDPTLDFAGLKAILVYNYGVAHRCCPLITNQTTGSTNCTSLQNFCLQIFQYAETLTPVTYHNLLFRLVMTRNLMMLTCRLGMSLCEHYKETLDPIERALRGPILPPNDDYGPHEAAAA